MPTDALHVAYSDQARTGTIVTDEHVQCLNSLNALLTGAGWSVTPLPAKLWVVFPWLPVSDVLADPGNILDIYDVDGSMWDINAVTVGQTFILVDPFLWRYYGPASVMTTGDSEAETASNILGKLQQVLGETYTITCSHEAPRVNPTPTSYEGYASGDPGEHWWYFTFERIDPGPDHNYDVIAGDTPVNSLYGNISLGMTARGGGYQWTSATSASNSASIILSAWGESQNPYDIDDQNDTHRVKMIARLAGDDDIEGRVPLSWPIGIPYAYGMTSAATIRGWACPHQFLWAETSGWNRNYDTSGAAAGDYGGILTCPWVVPDKGVTSAALFVRAVNDAYRNLSYGDEIFTGVNGPWRRLASLDHGSAPHPTHMLRAGHGAPVYTRGDEPVLLTPYLALSSAQTPQAGPKIVGQMWDAVALSDSRYGYRAKLNFDDRTFSLFAKANPLNNQSDASLWICS